MSNPLLITAAIGALAFTGTVEARGSLADQRGYDNCVSEAKQQSVGLATKRYYFLEKTDDAKQYFINASRWEAGERTPVRIDCATNLRGNRVLSAAIEPGRWVQDKGARVRVEIAQK